MCCKKNRTNTYGAGCRRGNAPYQSGSYAQRSVPDAYHSPAVYSQDTATMSVFTSTPTPTPTRQPRCRRRQRQRPCRRGGLISLLIGLVRESRAKRAIAFVEEETGGDGSWDRAVSSHQRGRDEFTTKDESAIRHGDGVYEKTGLLDYDDDESAREAAEPPSYETAVKSG